MIHSRVVAHFAIPLDLPHAGRLSDRLVTLLEKYAEELQLDVPDVIDLAERLSSFLFRNVQDDNPANAMEIRDEAATMGRELVDKMEAAQITSDRLGQLIRNLFECLELGEEGAAISLRAGENPNSLQRPI
jgi:hypothetical protein